MPEAIEGEHRHRDDAMGAVASRLDAWIVAEGVETEGELERVMALGVPLAQGFGLGRPAPAMLPLRPSVSGLGTGASRRAQGGLAALVATAPMWAHGAPRPETSGPLVILDEFGRPVALCLDGRRRSVLRVGVGDSVVDAARRAMTRPSDARFEPLACTDELGRFVGLVGVERLVESLVAGAA